MQLCRIIFYIQIGWRCSRNGDLPHIINLRQIGFDISFYIILNIGRIDNSAVGKLTLTIMLAFAEFERSMILERTAAGKAVAKTKAGYRDGRPPYKKAVIDNAMELLKTHTYKEVVEITGISRATLARYKQRYKEDIE